MAKELFELMRATKYPLEAFLFVQRGLDATVHSIHGKTKGTKNTQESDSRHVSGRQLSHGLRDYAISQYGLLAKSVLGGWNIHNCADFGHIVFALVDAGLMHKTEQDAIEDFTGVYDFDEAFAPELQLSENA